MVGIGLMRHHRWKVSGGLDHLGERFVGSRAGVSEIFLLLGVSSVMCRTVEILNVGATLFRSARGRALFRHHVHQL